jgi:hypothetical protein
MGSSKPNKYKTRIAYKSSAFWLSNRIVGSKLPNYEDKASNIYVTTDARKYAMCTSMILSSGHKLWRSMNRTATQFLKPSAKPTFIVTKQNPIYFPLSYASSATLSLGPGLNLIPLKPTTLQSGHNQQLLPMSEVFWD